MNQRWKFNHDVEKIKCGEKTIEYREVKPYWTKRLSSQFTTPVMEKLLRKRKKNKKLNSNKISFNKLGVRAYLEASSCKLST